MSDRRLLYTLNLTALMLSAELAREGRGFYRAPVEIAKDVEAILRLTECARRAVREHKSPAYAFAKIGKVVHVYGAVPVYGEAFPEGFLGLRFTKSRYGRPGSVFTVA